MSVEIQFVESFQDIDPGLWERCFPAPFEGLFWYQTLESCGLEDQFKFFYALIVDKSGGTPQPVGIAPCFLHDVPMSLVAPPVLVKVLDIASKVWPRANYQRTLFVGSPCADEGTIGLVPGVNLEDIILPLSRAVRQKGRQMGAAMVVFKDFPAECREAMDSLCRGAQYFRIPSYPGAVIDLAGDNIEGYFAALPRAKRQKFKRKLRQSAEVIALETTYRQNPSEQELAELFGLFMNTYEKGKTKFERLSLEFFRRIKEFPCAWFILQREKESGKMVTFMLAFKIGDRLINKFIGLDYSKGANTYLYFRQFEALLNFAYQQKVKQLQSGQTGYRAKLDLGHKLVDLDNYCRHTNDLFNIIYAKVSADITPETLDEDLVEHYAALKNNAKSGD
ncbi:MAG: N-acetyltransferase [Cyanobacteria bacterium SZAS TMP-1]|nr:N-acetyltransferase [Cyanobacteria bacterium SZAS TMP-1]